MYVIIEVPVHVCLHSYLHIHNCCTCLSDRYVWIKWKLAGWAVRGGLFPFPGSSFLYLAHWPVATALVLSMLCLWKTTRSHFRSVAFNWRPRSTVNVWFIKQWGHKGLGKRRQRSPWENPSYCKWGQAGRSLSDTLTHTYTASCTETGIILLWHPCVSIVSPFSLHICNQQTKQLKTQLDASNHSPARFTSCVWIEFVGKINQSMGQVCALWIFYSV